MIYEIDVLGDQKLCLKEGGEARDEEVSTYRFEVSFLSLVTTALRQVSIEFLPKRDDISNYMNSHLYKCETKNLFPKLNHAVGMHDQLHQ